MVEVIRASNFLHLNTENLEKSDFPVIMVATNKSGKNWYEYFPSLSQASKALEVSEERIMTSVVNPFYFKNYKYQAVKIFHHNHFILPYQKK